MVSYLSLSAEKEKDRFNTLRATALHDGELIYPGRLIYRAAQLYPDRVALIYKDIKVTYRELYRRVCLFSGVLREHGVCKGDRILICFENSIEFYVAYYAVWHVGAVVTPLNTFLHSNEVAHVMADAKPSLIIASTDKIETFTAAGVQNLPTVLTEEDIEKSFTAPGECSEQIVDVPLDTMVALLYTSGTTGLPKGVMLSGRNIMTNLLQGASRVTLNDGIVFGVLPLFHSFAQNLCVWTAMFVGATVIVVPKIDRRQILDGLKHKPTVVIGVPALYGLLCMLRPGNLDQVDLFVCGGDALSDRIRMAFSFLYRRQLCNGYGMTETSPLISADLEGVREPTNNVGRPFYGVQVSVRGEGGQELPQGQAGILWVKGEHIMLGYHNAPEETQKIIKDGWLDTGDMAYIDASGKIVLTGRLKDLIIHKGINIYPQEIENIILTHSNVIRVGVVGKPHEQSGEVPVAFVQLRKEQGNADAQLLKLCKQHLAAYKVPRSFICSTDELKTTATGKVDKKVLRKEFTSE